jgi:Ca2+-binding RTX toxin-like protein
MPNIYGTPNNKTFELIKGSNVDDLIFPLGGWDYVDGGAGKDTVVVMGLSSQFKLVQDNSVTYIDAVSSASAYADRVQLLNVEKVQFSDKVVSLETPRLMTAQPGDDEYQGGAGLDWLVYPGPRENYDVQAIGTAWRISDPSGQTGTDMLRGIDRVRFSDGVWLVKEGAWLSQTPHSTFANLPVELYQFFAVAFGAVPGVTYMNQLAEAYRHGLSVKEIVNIFTTKTQFTSVYDPGLSHGAVAQALITNIVQNSATEEAKREATADIQAALDFGMTLGDVIYNVFNNLSRFSPNDPQWGGTAQLMANQVNAARYATDTLNLDTTDMAVLRSLLSEVSAGSDTSTAQSTAQLVGLSLNAQGLVDEFSGHSSWLLLPA